MNPNATSTESRRFPWWATTAILLGLAALVLPWSARLVAGPPGAQVHVRWQSGVAQFERESLEARFTLTRREQIDERTWRYDLVDTGTANIRVLIEHPSVADTHDIDRSRYAITEGAVRTSRRQRFGGGGSGVVALADVFGVLFATAALLVVGHSAIKRGIGRIEAIAASVGSFLERGIPDIDARTAGTFRIVFGALVVSYFATDPVDSSLLDAAFDVNVNGDMHQAVLEWLRGRPWMVDAMAPWLLITGVAFTAGIATRVSYALFVAGVFVWAYVAVYTDSTHPHSTLILALVALLPSRWGDAMSVDAWRGVARPTYGPAYGYSVWVPCLVFGIAFAAAAWAKLNGGLTWVATGAVKYHFITDARLAPVTWGLHLVEYPRLAVAASLMAVTVETLVITAAFVRSEWYRLAIGIAALGLLIGFWLFMGVFWPGWWVLLLGFLPWEQLGRLPSVLRGPGKPAAPATFEKPAMTGLQAGFVLALLAQQVVVSAMRIERAPMFTYYPMYSATWSSVEAFNQSRPPLYRIVVSTDAGRVELRCNPSERLVTEFREAIEGSLSAAASVHRQLHACDRTVGAGQTVVFEEYRTAFDVADRTFKTTPTAGILGPLLLSSGKD